MKKYTLPFFLLILVNFICQAQDSSPAEGLWFGTLKLPQAELRLAVDITMDDVGMLAATLNSIDQGGVEIPMSSVKYDRDTLEVKGPALGISIRGELLPGSDSWSTIFRQGPAVLPLEMTRVDELPLQKRPQEPREPYPYRVEEVSYRNEAAGITLSGTLTLPEGDGPFPAVILLSGSGPQDRDEEIMGHRPFKVLADHLSRKGMVVLRSDDRGVGRSGGDFASATSADFARDALSALSFLNTRPEADPDRTGLIGHSEGGMVAALAASWEKDFDFIVMMAAPAIPFDELILYQKSNQWVRAGTSAGDIELNSAWHKKVYSLLGSDLSSGELTDTVRELYASYTPEEQKRLYPDTRSMEAELGMISSNWWRYASQFHTPDTLRKVDCPVLAINGTLDTQVPWEENLNAIEAVLKERADESYRVRSLEGLNHLFQTAETGDALEYGKIEETFSPVALELIADWILGL